MINPLQTVISQYANSDILLRLIQDWNEAIDPSVIIDDFYSKIWDLTTAEGYGLDVWGRIVGVPRTIPMINVGSVFGFDEGECQPFDQAPFSNGMDLLVSYKFQDVDYRQLIMLKAFANISGCTVVELNRMLMTAFGTRGKVFVRYLGPMAMEYVFNFAVTAVDNALLLQSGAILRPIAVNAMIKVEIDDIHVTEIMFGFDGTEGLPFGQAPMYDGNISRL